VHGVADWFHHAYANSNTTRFGAFTLPAEDPADLLHWLRAELVETIDPAGLAVQFVHRMGDAAQQLAALAG
jgi:hypothetical protein